MRHANRRPVLVLGNVPRIVVAVARSLHRHVIPVDVGNFASNRQISSRAIRRFTRLPSPDAAPGAFVASLCELIKQGGHDMVIPTDDQALVALTHHYAELMPLVTLACPPPSIANLALNKNSTLQLAGQCGIRIPQTRCISSTSELTTLIGKIPFPWILKPSEKRTEEEETKSRILSNDKQVAAVFPHAHAFSPPMLLQEVCPGQGVGVEILLHKGECRAVFQHRRVFELPYTGGFSVSAVAEPPNPVLVEQALALLRAMQWEGPAMVEFKVNPADGSAVLMEVNGRYWGTISLAIAAGVDFPLYQWQLAHGEKPAIPAVYRAGTRWRWTAGHIYRMHDLLVASRRSQGAQKTLLRSLLQLPLVFSPTVHDAVFRWTDPLPALADLSDAVSTAWRYDLDAIRRNMPSFLVHSSAK